MLRHRPETVPALRGPPNLGREPERTPGVDGGGIGQSIGLLVSVLQVSAGRSSATWRNSRCHLSFSNLIPLFSREESLSSNAAVELGRLSVLAAAGGRSRDAPGDIFSAGGGNRPEAD